MRDGILGHSGRAPLPRTLEGRIVRLVDRVAYINHDIDDALRAGVLREEDLPAEPIAVLGDTRLARASTRSSTTSSSTPSVAGDIVQGDEVGAAMDELRDVHVRARLPRADRRAREHAKIERVVRTLFDHYVADPDRLPDGGGAPGADLRPARHRLRSPA